MQSQTVSCTGAYFASLNLKNLSLHIYNLFSYLNVKNFIFNRFKKSLHTFLHQIVIRSVFRDIFHVFTTYGMLGIDVSSLSVELTYIDCIFCKFKNCKSRVIFCPTWCYDRNSSEFFKGSGIELSCDKYPNNDM